MKRKLVFLLGMVLGQCFVWGCGELEVLRGVFAWWQAKPEAWNIAFECTKDFVETVAGDKTFQCSGSDLMAISVFVNSKLCLKSFLESDVFKQSAQAYDSWLRNLYRIAYNTALKIKPKACYRFQKAFNRLLNDRSKSIIDLYENLEFMGYVAILSRVLMASIDWGD